MSLQARWLCGRVMSMRRLASTIHSGCSLLTPPSSQPSPGVRMTCASSLSTHMAGTVTDTSVAMATWQPLLSLCTSFRTVWDVTDLRCSHFTPKLPDWSLDLHTRAVPWPRLHQMLVTCTEPSFGYIESLKSV